MIYMTKVTKIDNIRITILSVLNGQLNGSNARCQHTPALLQWMEHHHS